MYSEMFSLSLLESLSLLLLQKFSQFRALKPQLNFGIYLLYDDVTASGLEGVCTPSVTSSLGYPDVGLQNPSYSATSC